jgi:hypothetical protein
MDGGEPGEVEPAAESEPVETENPDESDVGPLDLSEEEPAPPPGPPPSPAVGALWNPEPAREKIRGAVAVGLIVLLGVIAIGSFVLLSTDTLTLDEVEGLLTALFTPLLALTGTALGFYFGGQRRT